MAFQFDEYDGALVIDGWEHGIAKSPYEGISDIRNCLINSVPGEAAVGFSTASISTVVSSGTITFAAGTQFTFVSSGTLEANNAISFTSVGGYSGISAGTTVYWVGTLAGGTIVALYSDYQQSAQVSVSGSGNAPFTVYSPNFSTYQGNQPNKFARSSQSGNTFVQDSLGRVWTSKRVTATGRWTYVGNIRNSNGDVSNGNGLNYYQPTGGGAGYVFIFNDSSIDYFQDNTANTINYGWNPATASNNNGAPYLNAGAASGASHDSLVGQDNVVYYCDASFLGSFFEKSGQTFNPLTASTFTAAKQALKLPAIDTANCLAELGVSLLVGGTRNLIYPWDRTSTSFTYPIFLNEYLVQKMLTVNTNAFIFVGNRGRIHITNGTAAQPWAKIPDHLSGTVEPYFQWGGATFNKNNLYFSVKTTNNDGTTESQYGGIWGIDVETKSLRMVNQLSYGTYSGYAPTLFASSPLYNVGQSVGNTAGNSLIAGWDSGSSTYGIDQSSSNPYTGSQSYVDSDLIPIGSFEKPRNFQRIQYLLTKPLVAGESIKLQFRKNFGDSYTDIATDSTVGNYTNGFDVNFANMQWIQIRAVLTSTATNPSYVRLKHIRITSE